MVRWVRSGALTGAPTLVEQLGGAFGELANQAGLRPDILDHPDIPIDARTVPLFLDLAAKRLDCPSFGLRLRSEEHTSELQSLMRNSYAVFCLKKKNKTTTYTSAT